MSQTIRRALLEKFQALPEWRAFQEDFAVVTGLQVVLVEEAAGSVVVPEKTALCAWMSHDAAGRAVCGRFRQRLLVPRAEGANFACCDAGLMEIAVPLRVSGFPLGFLLVAGFQVEDAKTSPSAALARARHLLAKAGVEIPAETLGGLIALAPRVGARVCQAWVRWMELAVREMLSRLTAQAVESPAALPLAVEKATRLIRSRALQEEVTLPETARACGVSAGHLSRLFAHSTGLTFNAFVARYRAEHAANLLRNTQNSITDIAFASGFNSLSQFHRIFRKIYGSSPGKWRQISSLRTRRSEVPLG